MILHAAPAASLCLQRTPSTPSTLAISCGSETAATVPWRAAMRANPGGASNELSMCTWASTNPGQRKLTSVTPRSSHTAVILPWLTSM